MVNPDLRISNRLLKRILTSSEDGIMVTNDEHGGEIKAKTIYISKDKKKYRDANFILSKKGTGCQSSIPDAEFNFHTHPVGCYLSQRAIWGWPSGGDMSMLLKMNLENKIHFIFSLEGIYIIKINPIAREVLSRTQKDKIGYEFIKTHKYRSFDNYSKHHTYFKREFPFLKKMQSKNTLKLWLHLVNNQFFEYNNKKHKIFNVKLVRNESFQNDRDLQRSWNVLNILNSKNISKYVKIKKNVITKCEY